MTEMADRSFLLKILLVALRNLPEQQDQQGVRESLDLQDQQGKLVWQNLLDH